jgi:hypothetical protein
MSDQQASPQNGDTPAVAGPTEAPGTAQDQPQETSDYQKRYVDLQAEYTRSQQENSQLKHEREWAQAALTSSDPDIQRQAFEILGIETTEDDNDDFDGLEEFTDEDPYDQRIRALEERLSQQTMQEQQARIDEMIVDNAREQVQELGLGDASDRKLGTIFQLAYGLPRLPARPGQPPLLDMNTAYQEYQALMDEEMKGWAKTKRAPYVSPGGLPANEVPDPGTGHDARMNRALLRLRNDMGDE